MATGNEVETRGHVVGFREEIARAADSSADTFFTWFNSARDKDAAFVRGDWDFMVHIGTPAAPFIRSPEEKIVLEIGHGGGRLLAAASHSFEQVIGIDIHDNNAIVEAELHARGVHNFRLIQNEGSQIPLEDGVIDFLYSFIVLQHVERYEVFRSYLAESYRVLKPGGVAVIYFGRQAFFSQNRTLPLLYWVDQLLEPILLRGGYRSLPARVNETNLVVGLRHARRVVTEIGFVVRKTLVSRKSVPNGFAKYGGQHGLILEKPASLFSAQ